MRFLLVLGVGLFLGCAQPTRSADESPQPSSEPQGALSTVEEPTQQEYPFDPGLFGFLQTRFGTISITCTDDGPIYTIVGPDGVTVASDVGEDYLAENHPQIFEFIDGALAAGPLWAGH